MNTAARDAIFRAIDAGSGRKTTDSATIEREAQALLADPDAVRPPRTTDDVVDAFLNRVNGAKVAATATRIVSLQELPGIVKRMLTARALPSAVAVQPTGALTSLDWEGTGIAPTTEPDALYAERQHSVAIGLALWGIAETGSFVIHSAADSPILLHFLPAISIVAVPADRLLWHLEDYASATRTAGIAAPRNACLITGASGTTDIEGRLVTGAHGPGELQIVVFDHSQP